MAKAKAWEVNDKVWSHVEPLIQVRQRVADQTYARKTGGGRKPKDARLVFVLRIGCQCKALPSESFGSASAIHASLHRSACSEGHRGERLHCSRQGPRARSQKTQTQTQKEGQTVDRRSGAQLVQPVSQTVGAI
jgi:hypothetical protein